MNCRVNRTRDNTTVFYNHELSNNQDVLASTALTADSFYHFLLGPLGLPSDLQWTRLKDGRANDRDYYRIYAKRRPGFGLSEEDEVVLWVDKQSKLTFRTHITLEGYKTTKGAHVDVSFLEYQSIDEFTFPTAFFECVLGPIKIDAHAWKAESISINENITLESLSGPKKQ